MCDRPRALTNSAIVSPRAPSHLCASQALNAVSVAATHRHNAALVAFAQHVFRPRPRQSSIATVRYRARPALQLGQTRPQP
jgi:hypothetical protein